MDRKQRISYLPLDAMDDEMRAEMERCRREGTPRPESSAGRNRRFDAPGFGTPQELSASKAVGDCWARVPGPAAGRG